MDQTTQYRKLMSDDRMTVASMRQQGLDLLRQEESNVQGDATMNETQHAGGAPIDSEVRPVGAYVLHCYAQHSWHTEAYISGSRDALTLLRAAIDKALADGLSECKTCAADGECYSVYVVAMSDADAERQVVPYTADYAARDWSGAPGPWDALKQREDAKKVA